MKSIPRFEPRYEQIPERSRRLRNWVVWRYEKRKRKDGTEYLTKVPCNARTGKHAKSNDPSTWSTFEEALEALRRSHHYNGIGFCLDGDIVAVDLDGCRQNGTFEDWAEKIIHELSSYTEGSPCDGAHVIVTGKLPDGWREHHFGDRPHHGVALYEAGGPRYVTMTGCRIGDRVTVEERTAEPEPKPQAKAKTKTSASVSDDDDLVARARKARDDGKFDRLWLGQWEGEYPSQSEADMALCMKLAFWTDRDAARTDALFRRSGLMRDKWNRQNYRESTIAKAIARTTETWKPKPRPAAPSAAVIDLSRFASSLDLLNGLIVWQGRIEFVSVKRKGPMLIATTSDNVEIVWESTAELGSFSKSQAVISDATNIWIPTPPHRQIRSQWEQAIYLLLKLSAQDDIRLEPALKEEIRDLLRLVWRAARQPTAEDSGQFIDFIRALGRTGRNPKWGWEDPTTKPKPSAAKLPNVEVEIPPCVFIAEGVVWVHVPSFRLWLSIPALASSGSSAPMQIPQQHH
jgi:hypothetical protein